MADEAPDEMVEAVEGLGRVDVRLLRFVHRHDRVEDSEFVFNPRVVGSNIGEDNDYVSKRSRRLEAADVFHRPRKGEYHLTDLGRRLRYISQNRRDLPLRQPLHPPALVLVTAST